MKEKIFTKDVIGWLALFLLIIASNLFLPKSGRLVLLDEIADLLIILIISIYFVFMLFKKKDSIIYKKKYGKSLIFILFILINGFFCRNIILDFVNGPTEMKLHNVSTSRTQNRTVSHYYLNGDDSYGNSHRFEISIDDVNYINSLDHTRRTSIIVVYYEHTNRVVKIRY